MSVCCAFPKTLTAFRSELCPLPGHHSRMISRMGMESGELLVWKVSRSPLASALAVFPKSIGFLLCETMLT